MILHLCLRTSRRHWQALACLLKLLPKKWWDLRMKGTNKIKSTGIIIIIIIIIINMIIIIVVNIIILGEGQGKSMMKIMSGFSRTMICNLLHHLPISIQCFHCAQYQIGRGRRAPSFHWISLTAPDIVLHAQISHFSLQTLKWPVIFS